MRVTWLGRRFATRAGDTMPPRDVILDDIEYTPDGTVMVLREGAEVHTVTVGGLGPAVVDQVMAEVIARHAAGEAIDEVLRGLDVADVPHRTFRRRAVNGSLVLDDTGSITPLDVRRSLRVLADLGRTGLRTVAVIGPLDVAEADRLDSHDALGRIIVRLDVAQLIVIGHDARHLHMAAGLEGSWDGESVLFDDAVSAYDFVRAQLGSNTVMVVSGGAGRPDLSELVERLATES